MKLFKTKVFKIILFGCFLLFSIIGRNKSIAGDRQFGLSARRLPGRSSSFYLNKLDNETRKRNNELSEPYGAGQSQNDIVSVRDNAISYSKMDWNLVKDLHLNDEITTGMFDFVRDLRFIDHEGPFDTIRKRRITWLYPDDGCFARSALAQSLIKNSKKGPVLQQFFVFGDLQVKTPNNEDGWVTWWYHVAPIYKSNDKIYIIDPAIESKKTLLLSEWLDRISTDKNDLQVSLCDEKSYDPSSPCFGNSDDTLNIALSAENNLFLDAELQRIQILNRNPEQELGDAPPWVNTKR